MFTYRARSPKYITCKPLDLSFCRSYSCLIDSSQSIIASHWVLHSVLWVLAYNSDLFHLWRKFAQVNMSLAHWQRKKECYSLKFKFKRRESTHFWLITNSSSSSHRRDIHFRGNCVAAALLVNGVDIETVRSLALTEDICAQLWLRNHSWALSKVDRR